MAETNEELVNTLTLAAATILSSLIQAKLTAQHNDRKGCEGRVAAPRKDPANPVAFVVFRRVHQPA